MSSAFLLHAGSFADDALPLSMGAPMGAAWGATYGFPPALAPAFVAPARALGAGFTRVTLAWSQLEPKPGVPRWDDLDAYVRQVRSPDEGIVTLTSASPWATRTSTWVFPSSPAKDAESYYRFVRDTVRHVDGRIRYFQNDTEPNNAFFWSGSVDDFIAQQKIFYRAVKDADPDARVVLAGCDGLFDPTGRDPLPRQAENIAFFSRLVAGTAHDFDVFDLHLYADPYTIPARAAFVRDLIRRAGGDPPIIATESAGPTFFEFRANRRHASALFGPAAADAVRGLAARDDLPVETRMFLSNASPDAVARLRRLQARDLTVRQVLAYASGVQKVAFWDLWHDTRDTGNANTLMFGALRLFDREVDGRLEATWLGDAYSRLAARLGDATRVRRIEIAGSPDLFAFRVERAARGALLVVWRKPVDPALDVAPDSASVPWPTGSLRAATLFGDAVEVGTDPAVARLMVGSDPVFVRVGDLITRFAAVAATTARSRSPPAYRARCR